MHASELAPAALPSLSELSKLLLPVLVVEDLPLLSASEAAPVRRRRRRGGVGVEIVVLGGLLPGAGMTARLWRWWCGCGVAVQGDAYQALRTEVAA